VKQSYQYLIFLDILVWFQHINWECSISISEEHSASTLILWKSISEWSSSMRSTFWSTIPPISTKQTSTSHHVWNPDPYLEQAQKWGEVKPANGISTLLLSF
jgi:hypothetical protein